MSDDLTRKIEEIRHLYGLDRTEALRVLEAHRSAYERPETAAQKINELVTLVSKVFFL